MSNYAFAPSPDIALKSVNFAYWENGFTNDEIDEIRRIGDAMPLQEAIVGTETGNVCPQIRKSKTAWMNYDSCPMLYDRLAFIARNLNGQYFDFDLHGFVEDFQYTVYGPEKEHYVWHMDKGPSSGPPRKLSLVLQLSDPSEYDGGDLELMDSNTPIAVTKAKGMVYAFPSYILHRVTPITRGTRRSLVVWTCGPRFR